MAEAKGGVIKDVCKFKHTIRANQRGSKPIVLTTGVSIGARYWSDIIAQFALTPRTCLNSFSLSRDKSLLRQNLDCPAVGISDCFRDYRFMSPTYIWQYIGQPVIFVAKMATACRSDMSLGNYSRPTSYDDS